MWLFPPAVAARVTVVIGVKQFGFRIQPQRISLGVIEEIARQINAGAGFEFHGSLAEPGEGAMFEADSGNIRCQQSRW